MFAPDVKADVRGESWNLPLQIMGLPDDRRGIDFYPL